MARMKPKAETTTVLFDVFYDDGARSSNRKVPSSEMGGPDSEAAARSYLEAQERMIGDRSGRPPRVIARIVRSS